MTTYAMTLVTVRDVTLWHDSVTWLIHHDSHHSSWRVSVTWLHVMTRIPMWYSIVKRGSPPTNQTCWRTSYFVKTESYDMTRLFVVCDMPLRHAFVEWFCDVNHIYTDATRDCVTHTYRLLYSMTPISNHFMTHSYIYICICTYIRMLRKIVSHIFTDATQECVSFI